jgi:hypothetical protein
MSNIAMQGGATGTGTVTLLAPVTNTNRTLTLPDATGTVLSTATAGVPINGPAFSAYRTGTQAYSSNTFTKIQLNTESFDTNSCYDSTTNYRFTPTVAGYYICTGQIQTSAGTYVETDIYKNGVSNGYSQINGAWGIPTTQLIYLNGSTDYIELYGFVTTSGNIQPGLATYFHASMVRSAV